MIIRKIRRFFSLSDVSFLYSAFFLFILLQSYFWGWKTSGTFQATHLWNGGYPWGYGSILETPWGEWPINKENYIYIEHHQSFLNVADQFIRPHSGFEFLRSLYGYLTSSLWFLGPIFSGIMLNIIFWFCSLAAMIYICRFFYPQNKTAWLVGGTLVTFGQGFLQSVGEISPHILGYSLGFWLGAYTLSKRLWESDTPDQDHYLVHATLGLLKLGYESAWMYYPYIILLSAFSRYQKSQSGPYTPILTFSIKCSLFSLTPGLLMILLSKPFKGGDGVLFVMKMLQDMPFQSIAERYILTLLDSFLSFGPLFILTLAGLVCALRRTHYPFLFMTAVTFSMFLLLALILIPVSARGYTSFAFALPIFLLAVAGYLYLNEAKHLAVKVLAPLLLCTQIAWAFLPLFGYSFALKGFSWGYITMMKQQNLRPYDVQPFYKAQ